MQNTEILEQPEAKEANVVTLASRVPPSLMELVKKFAKNTKRTVSASVYYLVESHPELEQLKAETANNQN